MQRIFVAMLTTITLVAGVASSRDASAQGTSVQVALTVGDWSANSPPLSLTVGVAEPGQGSDLSR
jgi:hypothetical protein